MSRTLTPADARIAALEDRQRLLEDSIRQLTQRLARAGDPRNPRLAITVTITEGEGEEAEEVYPTRAEGCNTYWIRFVDSSHAETEPADATITDAPRTSAQPTVLATNIQPDPFVPLGTRLTVFWDNGRWWFDYSDRLFRGRLTEALSAGSSASVQPQQDDGAGGYEDAPGASVTVWDDGSTSMTGAANDIALVHWDRDSQKYWFVQKECHTPE